MKMNGVPHALSFPVRQNFTAEFELEYHHSWEGRTAYEPEVVNVVKHFIEPGDVCVDGGANMGFFTCLFSRLVGDDGLVLAFEPGSIAFRRLVHNVALNKMNNVGCYQQGLFSHDCFMDLHFLEREGVLQLGYSSLHSYPDSIGHERVELRALDTLLINDSEHPRVIKLDIEGVEEEALKGAERILRRGVDCVVVEMNYKLMEGIKGRSDRGIRDFMASIGYDMFLINIWDKERDDYAKPICVEPEVEVKLDYGPNNERPAINVMFSTRDKVRLRWSGE